MSAAEKIEQHHRIGPRDEADLEWYFGPGRGQFERSTFGGIIDRLIMASAVSTKCSKCESGILETGEWCPRCKGVGFTTRTKQKERIPRDPKDAITARPTCENREEHGYTPDDRALHRLARVSRRLDRMTVTHRMVLEAYYGDRGAKWGRTRFTRMFAVYSLTAAGTRLARLSAATSQQDMAPDERLGVEAEVDKTQTRRDRRALLDKAGVEAVTMFVAAGDAWWKTWER